jgi:hypothetical protein
VAVLAFGLAARAPPRHRAITHARKDSTS